MSDTAARLLALLVPAAVAPRLDAAPSSPRGSASPPARSATTSSACASSTTRSTPRAAPTGGYRLGAGGKLPPLLLDDEEAVAVAIGLRAATGIAGIEESSTRALAKLEQVLPSRLRPTVDALGTVVDHAPENTGTDAPDPEVDPAVLARHRRARSATSEWLRFDYRGDARLVEPYRLLALAAPLVPRRPRPAVGRVGRLPRRLDRAADADPPPLLPRRRCPAATTPLRDALDRRRAAGRCTRASASPRRPRPCSRASTPTVGVVEAVADDDIGARHRRRLPRHDRRVHRHAGHGLHGRVARRAAALLRTYSERYARAAGGES